MSVTMMDLLQRLFDANRRAGDEQTLEGPPEAPERIAVLATGQTRPITPMLRARFQLAGRWEEAWAGQTWLSPTDMEHAWNDAALLEQIATRERHWERSVLVAPGRPRVSLFGVNRVDLEETYLVWPEADGEEPAVVVYMSQRETRYPSLRAYLEFLTAGDR